MSRVASPTDESISEGRPRASRCWQSGGDVVCCHFSKYEWTMRVERSADRPMSVVDLGAARIRGVWRPRPCEGSCAVPKSSFVGGGWGTLMKGASGCPARRLRGWYWSAACACARRSRITTCMYVGGRIEVEVITTEASVEECEVVVRLVVWFRVGFVVGCVCWRHTTMSDGNWVWWMFAADVNVRTLSGARDGALAPWRGQICQRWRILCVRSTVGDTCLNFKAGGARATGRTEFEVRKATPCCVYGMVSLRIH
jgi:hypothetical protein